MEVIQDCGFLMRMYEEDKRNHVVIDDEYIKNLINLIPFDMKKVKKLINGYYGFTSKEYPEIINQLNYLEYKYLDDILLFVKFKDSKRIRNNIPKDLKIKYDEQRIFLNKFDTFKYKGNLSICKWIYSLGHTEMKPEYFVSVCSTGHLDIAEWVFSSCPDINVQTGFYSSCEHGHLNLAKWVLTKGVDLDKINLTELFARSCLRSNLECAKWIYSLDTKYTINIYFDNNYAFRSSCATEHVDLVEWILTLYPGSKVNIDVLKFIHEVKNLKIAKLLYEIGLINNSNIHECFKISCIWCNFEVVPWLYSLIENKDLIDIDMLFEETATTNSYRIISTQNLINVLKWIYNLGLKNEKTVLNDVFINLYINNTFVNGELLKFIYSFGAISDNMIEKSFLELQRDLL